MRVSFVLFAVISLGIGSVATSAEKTSLSTTGLVNSVDPVTEGNNNRFLRRYRESEEENALDSNDDEERGPSISAQQISDLIGGRTRAIFTAWRNAGHEQSAVRDSLKQAYKNGMLTKENYKKVARWYLDGYSR
ncbi:RxLR effector protein [Phytophthora megakarya]|uniref:RxLR effector protein n=1 Tax=Phytophthora megakarya TaxID=4795 RepID=A0A225VLI4_9STRA|nr:RxLR effector protein [Phytophthora megakarya]